MRSQIEAEISAAGLQDRFELPGWVTPEQVLEQYAQSDILFMPSLAEGFPLTGVQGAAMGLALIASRVGGFIDLIHPGENGYLFDPMDTQGMQTGLRSLLSNPDLLLQMRKNSRNLSKRFDLNIIVDDYETIFNRVVINQVDFQSTHE